MSIEEKMTIDERRKYLRKMQKRYAKANRKEKGRLLDKMEQVTELKCKYLIGLMKGSLKRKRRRKQRGRTTTKLFWSLEQRGAEQSQRFAELSKNSVRLCAFSANLCVTILLGTEIRKT
jgi:hypothetical protein